MKSLPREVWHYAALLVLLFAIAGLAAWHVIGYIADRVHPDEMHIAAGMIWSLTLGFMLIAGAFGLWAIQFAAEAESLRRIGKLVDAMHYLDDGLLAIDGKGIVKGSNPAIETMTNHANPDGARLTELFPSIPPADARQLYANRLTHEVESEETVDGQPRMLRFRSQPAEGISLILVSDVTAMNRQRLKRRQMARLQLVGELARGVATDFDNLLAGIAMHASLLGRLVPPHADTRKFLDAIAKASRRGSVLASHLLQLAATPPAGFANEAFEDHVRASATSLLNSLPDGWKIDCQVESPAVPVQLTSLQVEQIVINLGLLMVDATQEPACISLLVRPILEADGADTVARFAGWLLLIVRHGADGADFDAVRSRQRPIEGVIGSVLKNMLEGMGGSLDYYSTDEGLPAYRIGLPIGTPAPLDTVEVPAELRAYVAPWSIMVCADRRGPQTTDEQLRRIGLSVTVFDEIGEALARLQEDLNLDVCVFGERQLGHEPAGLLRAIVKLRPSAGIVVLAEEPQILCKGLSEDAVFLPTRPSVSRLVVGLIDARGLALRRARPSQFPA